MTSSSPSPHFFHFPAPNNHLPTLYLIEFDLIFLYLKKKKIDGLVLIPTDSFDAYPSIWGEQLRVWVLVLVFLNLKSQSWEEFCISIVQLQWVERLSAPVKKSQDTFVSGFSFCQGWLIKYLGATPDMASTFLTFRILSPYERVEFRQLLLICARLAKGTGWPLKDSQVSQCVISSRFGRPGQGAPNSQTCWGTWQPRRWPGSKGVIFVWMV